MSSIVTALTALTGLTGLTGLSFASVATLLSQVRIAVLLQLEVGVDRGRFDPGPGREGIGEDEEEMAQGGHDASARGYWCH
jgi:hypothetical protein